jgi:cyanophycinase-like exopeptidase
MAPVHRAVIARLAAGLGRPARAVILDTPYGFQENADHLTERIVRFFRDRVGVDATPIHLPRAGDPTADAAATEAVRQADFVFAGPGSPSYALRHWQASGVAWALRDKVEHGGALSFASAAAITMGAFATPVYEIYKAGHDPAWSTGLDLLGLCGLRVALVPHYDNTEGAGHDTRYSYVGERRLRQLEGMLPADAWVLGIDERTSLILDLDDATAEVRGPGSVTVRRRGRERRFGAGGRFPIRQLAPPSLRKSPAMPPVDGLEDGLESRIARAFDAGDVDAAVSASIELERATAASGAPYGDRARHAVRAAILRLGDMAGAARAEGGTLATLVDALLDVRSRARDAGDWARADEIRDLLSLAGLSVRDTDGGPVWTSSGDLPPQPSGARVGRSGVGRPGVSRSSEVPARGLGGSPPRRAGTVSRRRR